MKPQFCNSSFTVHFIPKHYFCFDTFKNPEHGSFTMLRVFISPLLESILNLKKIIQPEDIRLRSQL